MMKTSSFAAGVLVAIVASVTSAADPLGGYRSTSPVPAIGHAVDFLASTHTSTPETASWSTEHSDQTPQGSDVAPVGYWSTESPGSPNAIPSPVTRPPIPQQRTYQPVFKLDTPITDELLDFQNRQTGKQLFVLESQRRAEGYPSVTLGAQFRASALGAYTNRAGKFSYLGRFPPGFDDQTASDVRLLQANQAIVAHVGHGVSGYFETLFSDVFSFQSFNQGSWQVRQAYVVLGDLDQTPWYGWIGKKTLDFGDLGTLSPFTQAVPWHYFAPLAEGAGVGYSDGRVHITAAAVNGGRGIRVADSTGRGNLENFVANATVIFPFADDGLFTLGAGYLHSTIYDGLTAEHTNPNIVGPRNGALDVNARFDYGPVSLAGEYITTVDPWPVVAHRVEAWKAEGAYRITGLNRPAFLSVSYSEGIQGAAGTDFEFNRQLVVGARVDFTPNVYGTLEWVRSMGFAPLINITTVSDREVVQDSAVVGLVVVL